MSDAEYATLPDLSEGIEYRLRQAAESFCARDNVLQAAKTRRYPFSRLSRLAAHALLGITDAALQHQELPDAAWLLGFRREASPLFNHFKQNATMPIISKAADFDRSSSWFQTEMRAWDLWALGAGLPSGLMLTQGVIVE